MRRVVECCGASLQCVFLSTCYGERIAASLHEAFAHLTVIGWRERVDDRAATAFGEGFYNYLGEQLKQGHADSAIDVAYERAAEQFRARGFREGNPNPRRGDDGRVRSDFDGQHFKLDGTTHASGYSGS